MKHENAPSANVRIEAASVSIDMVTKGGQAGDVKLPPPPISHVEILIVLRNRLSLTQTQAAKRWGIPVRTLRAWENRQTTPSAVNDGVIETLIAYEMDAAASANRSKKKQKRPRK